MQWEGAEEAVLEKLMTGSSDGNRAGVRNRERETRVPGEIDVFF